MAKVIICCNCHSTGTFLSRSLGMDEPLRLRLQKHSYKTLLHKFLDREEAEWFFVENAPPRSMKDLLKFIYRWQQTSECVQHESDRYCVINLQYFPASFEELKHQVCKGFLSDIPLAIYGDDDSSPALSFFGRAELQRGEWPTEAAELHLPDAWMNLTVPSDVLSLFNSSLIARNFNSIVSGTSGYFVKSSAQKSKMEAEHSYLSNLPFAVRPYFPQCGRLLDMGNKAGYEVEAIPSMDAGKLLLNGFFFEEEACTLFMRKIEDYWRAQPRRTVSTTIVRDQMEAAFVSKTRSRMKTLLKLPEAEQLDSLVRFQRGQSLEEFGDAYVQLLEEDIASHGETELCYAHGDLFFGNMLYDPTSRTLKLVDPRGGKGDVCWLPVWYDLAKLSHSFLGGYDLMVYGLMKPVLKKNMRFGLWREEPFKDCSKLESVFNTFLSRNHIDRVRLRLYEGSLFLSMLPLHKEAPRRMACQLLRAIELYELVTSS